MLRLRPVQKHALGLSAADTAELDFGRNSPSSWPGLRSKKTEDTIACDGLPIAFQMGDPLSPFLM